MVLCEKKVVFLASKKKIDFIKQVSQLVKRCAANQLKCLKQIDPYVTTIDPYVTTINPILIYV